MEYNVDTELLQELIRGVKPIITDRTLAAEVNEKGLDDFVTTVDTGVQAYLEKKLAELYPKIQFMGEEGARRSVDPNGAVWIIDPVDGTTNLIHDYRASAVSAGLYVKGEAVIGIVYDPFKEEMFAAEKGCGAYLNGRRIAVSGAGCVADSLIAVGTSPYEKELADKNFEIFKRVFKASQDIRRSGSAALDLCCIAAGRTDGYFERNLKPWDFAAGLVIVSEAGGRVTDYGKNKIFPLKNADVFATNGIIHDELAELIAF